MHRRPFLIGLGALGLIGCQGRSAARESRPDARAYATLGGDEPLRRIFNHDVGKVRVLMLVSPT